MRPGAAAVEPAGIPACSRSARSSSGMPPVLAHADELVEGVGQVQLAAPGRHRKRVPALPEELDRVAPPGGRGQQRSRGPDHVLARGLLAGARAVVCRSRSRKSVKYGVRSSSSSLTIGRPWRAVAGQCTRRTSSPGRKSRTPRYTALVPARAAVGSVGAKLVRAPSWSRPPTRWTRGKTSKGRMSGRTRRGGEEAQWIGNGHARAGPPCRRPTGASTPCGRPAGAVGRVAADRGRAGPCLRRARRRTSRGPRRGRRPRGPGSRGRSPPAPLRPRTHSRSGCGARRGGRFCGVPWLGRVATSRSSTRAKATRDGARSTPPEEEAEARGEPRGRSGSGSRGPRQGSGRRARSIGTSTVRSTSSTTRAPSMPWTRARGFATMRWASTLRARRFTWSGVT